MNVIVQTPDGVWTETSPPEMAALAGRSFPASDRVPGAVGEAFDLADWIAAYAARRTGTSDVVAATAPTHLIVRAADEFEAIIPWTQLKEAFFLFALNGAPLAKGGPLRLYVPDGSSACLNVKQVTHIRIAADPEMGDQAGYGFRNEISPARLTQRFTTRNEP